MGCLEPFFTADVKSSAILSLLRVPGLRHELSMGEGLPDQNWFVRWLCSMPFDAEQVEPPECNENQRASRQTQQQHNCFQHDRFVSAAGAHASGPAIPPWPAKCDQTSNLRTVRGNTPLHSMHRIALSLL